MAAYVIPLGTDSRPFNLKIMEYEKKYNEALERARDFHDGPTANVVTRTFLEQVFPELRESEDERARKAALEGIEYLERKLGWDAIGDTDILDVKEYLEKQKEQKPAERIEDSVKFEEGFKAGRESGLRDGQKYVLNNLDSYGLCKPAEWSEEDEKRIDAICELLENTSAIHPNYSCRKLIIWLKSLRPQPHWKPGEEQPEVDLEKAALHVYESWMGGTMNDVRRDMVELGNVLNARKED